MRLPGSAMHAWAQRIECHPVGSVSDQMDLFAAANDAPLPLWREIHPLACGLLRNDNKAAAPLSHSTNQNVDVR